MTDKLVEVRNIVKYFPIKGGIFLRVLRVVHAVDGVSFHIKRGEAFGLVGESGCGKTTLARCILRFIEPTCGEIYFDGLNISRLNDAGMRKLRYKMQMVFQNPYASLNPRMRVRATVGEPLLINRIAKGEDLDKKVLELLLKIGLSKHHLDRFPHEFSGGQRQRIVIARALALNPEFIVLDEPTSMLDVSVQAQILNLLKDLQKELQLTYLLISHNLSVVVHICNRIAVMYMGKVVEIAETKELLLKHLHPYSEALFLAVPIPDPDMKRDKIILWGEVPNPVNPPSGCRFHPRCSLAIPKCKKIEPKLVDVKGGHMVSCLLYSL